MKKWILLLYLFTACIKVGQAQIIVSPEVVLSLPNSISESSGLIFWGSDSLLTHNDSGNKAKLYWLDTLGELLQAYDLSERIKVDDWEELTKDDNGNLYLGDFGNNDNLRQNLRIFKIFGNLDKPNSLKIDTISFTYEDQLSFPPPSSFLHFDCEAFVSLGDSLYLFTKDRTSPYKSECRMYVLSNKKGTQIAKYKSSFNTGLGSLFLGSVTGAALSPQKNALILIGYARMWLFKNFTSNDFFDVEPIVFQYSDFSQKEAVAFQDSSTIYLTDESSILTGNPGRLFKLSLNQPITSTTDDNGHKIQCFVFHESDEISIQLNSKARECVFYSAMGKIIRKARFSQQGNHWVAKYNPGFLSPQSIFYSVISENGTILASGKLIH